MGTGLTAYTQKYKTAADTVKLNKEFTEVSNDIADLTANLTNSTKQPAWLPIESQYCRIKCAGSSGKQQ